MPAAQDGPWPLELRIAKSRAELVVTFDNGETARLPAEYLRVFTPSAERTGHGSRRVIGGKANVTIKDAAAVGRYAVRLTFSDGHNTGIYPLDRLAVLHRSLNDNWSKYLSELEALGLSREHPGSAAAPPAAR
ncbi:MAG: gamma-butyrobetaine hydroxylase-like domain-containing protein [Pseudomonadota bacterium]